MIKSFKMFENVDATQIKKDIEDCLVELNDSNYEFEYLIFLNLYESITVEIKINESDVPDEEYFSTTKPFNSLVITEPVLLLESYIKDKFSKVSVNYFFNFDYDDSEVFSIFPTEKDIRRLIEDDDRRADSVLYTEKLIINFKIKK